MQSIDDLRIFGGKSWFSLPFLYLLITAALGVFLRLLQSFPIEVKFTNVMHAHSHLALLGWCNTALMIFLVNSFVPTSSKRRKMYHRIFYAFQFAVFGMLFFFPFQGYSLTTISFSSFFIIVSYFFAYRFLKDTAKHKKSSVPLSFARTSIWFLILSSIGPWSLGPLNANGLGGSDLYFNMIYFYLHFLYNGYFLFAIFALLFAYLENKQITFNKKQLGFAKLMLAVSTLLAYTLSVLWVKPAQWVYAVGVIAVILQLFAVGMILRNTIRLRNQITFPSPFYRVLAYSVFAAILLKILLQTSSAVPELAAQIAIRRDWVLAYLHLIFLGIITPFILLSFYRWYQDGTISKISKWGLIVFVFGFIFHELLMVIKGVTT